MRKITKSSLPLETCEVGGRELYPMIVHIANRLWTEGCPLTKHELITEGLYGVAQANERYSADQGTQFITFAYHQVRGRMLDAIDREARHAHRFKPVDSARLAEVRVAVPRVEAALDHKHTLARVRAIMRREFSAEDIELLLLYTTADNDADFVAECLCLSKEYVVERVGRCLRVLRARLT